MFQKWQIYKGWYQNSFNLRGQTWKALSDKKVNDMNIHTKTKFQDNICVEYLKHMVSKYMNLDPALDMSSVALGGGIFLDFTVLSRVHLTVNNSVKVALKSREISNSYKETKRKWKKLVKRKAVAFHCEDFSWVSILTRIPLLLLWQNEDVSKVKLYHKAINKKLGF